MFGGAVHPLELPSTSLGLASTSRQRKSGSLFSVGCPLPRKAEVATFRNLKLGHAGQDANADRAQRARVQLSAARVRCAMGRRQSNMACTQLNTEPDDLYPDQRIQLRETNRIAATASDAAVY